MLVPKIFTDMLPSVVGRYMVPSLCFSKDMQTATYEIVNGSYVPNDPNKLNKVKVLVL